MNHKINGRMIDNELVILVDGKMIAPGQSQRFINHSPNGFSAGYLGSGCAQTALAIMMSLTNRENSMVYHQAFKAEFLSNPEYLNNDFEFEVDLDAWVADQEKLSANS